jgi:hypothetical protein
MVWAVLNLIRPAPSIGLDFRRLLQSADPSNFMRGIQRRVREEGRDRRCERLRVVRPRAIPKPRKVLDLALTDLDLGQVKPTFAPVACRLHPFFCADRHVASVTSASVIKADDKPLHTPHFDCGAEPRISRSVENFSMSLQTLLDAAFNTESRGIHCAGPATRGAVPRAMMRDVRFGPFVYATSCFG